MKLEKSSIAGVYLITPDVFPDQRGEFVKIFSSTAWKKAGLLTNFCESYYSVSKRGVIRGLHFQVPPHQHTKLVYVPYGKITDVLLDIRVGSATYGQHVAYEVSAKNHLLVYVPPGIAHGFEALSSPTVVSYLQNSEHSPGSDLGINTQSIAMKWQTKSPIVSERDQQLPLLADFHSPFK